MDCLSFSKHLIEFIRNANVSKTHAEQLITLIQSGLPQPNTLPNNYSDLLKLLSVEDIFIKRLLCINCKSDLSTTSTKCLKCTNDNSERLALVFDAIQEIVFTRTYDRLCSTIDTYRETFTKQKIDHDINDIVYNQNYRTLCDSNPYPFLTILLHLDGISLGKSNTQCLWILNGSIIELPPAIRTRRQNNLILSLWIGNEHPNVELWLNRCFHQLLDLKYKGKLSI
ncbi:unnamed protein product [Rotaria sp. Silwood1]|nr:unnamed protein product [Rotaria sp. Silwood1]